MTHTPFEPQNVLEHLLLVAATDAAGRPRFLEKLLESEILILPGGELPTLQDGVIPTGSTLSLQVLEREGQRYIPFFTSEARLPAGQRYLRMQCRDLFQMVKGGHLVMNPGSAIGKEFFPGEVASLLDGSFFSPGEQYVVPENRQMLLAQPAKRPEKLLATLSRLYSKNPAIRAAYLALCHDAQRDSHPGLLIALDVDSDAALEQAAAETGIVIRQGGHGVEGQIDVGRFDQSGIGGYFVKGKIPPFYQREKKSWLKRLLG